MSTVVHFAGFLLWAAILRAPGPHSGPLLPLPAFSGWLQRTSDTFVPNPFKRPIDQDPKGLNEGARKTLDCETRVERNQARVAAIDWVGKLDLSMIMEKGISRSAVNSKRRTEGSAARCSITVDSLSGLLLDLYRCSRELPLADFQRQALERLQLVLPFDKAWWGIGTSDRELHGSFAFHLPTSYAAAWERIKRQDLLADLAQSSIGRTVAVDFAAPAVVAEYRTFGAQFGIRHALTTFEWNTELNLRMFLSIYRAPDQPRFSGAERQLKELLMPHLWAAWTANWIGHLQRLRANASSSRAALAVADDRGVLLAAEPRFLELTRSEWPGWQGPELPSCVHTVIAAGAGYVGTHIELKSASVQGLHLVELRQRSRLDELTPRERAVAEAFGIGRSYREIAAALGRSPTTIRHHLRVVYWKLGISDKVELAHLVNANVEGAAERVI